MAAGYYLMGKLPHVYYRLGLARAEHIPPIMGNQQMGEISLPGGIVVATAEGSSYSSLERPKLETPEASVLDQVDQQEQHHN
jgi:hypothetical protein